jgi:ASC-1-like (ASCH) protein
MCPIHEKSNLYLKVISQQIYNHFENTLLQGLHKVFPHILLSKENIERANSMYSTFYYSALDKKLLEFYARCHECSLKNGI